jgi:hypothetical protein
VWNDPGQWVQHIFAIVSIPRGYRIELGVIATHALISPTDEAHFLQLDVFYKRIFPLFWFGFLALFVITDLLVSRRGAVPVPVLVVPVVMAIIGFMVFRQMLFSLVDEVWDDGNALVVRNGGSEERVMLSNIMNINFTTMSNPQRVMLTLRESGGLGKEIAFMSPRRAMLFGRSPIIDELIERVDRARTESRR